MLLGFFMSNCNNRVTISNVSLSTYFAMTVMSQLLDIIYVRQLKAHVEPRSLYIRLENFPKFLRTFSESPSAAKTEKVRRCGHYLVGIMTD